ncbi:MAG: chorismate mutase [Desulfosudis oleivorans]|nr:chorismate mutase [Desulfosudis oleivorans]
MNERAQISVQIGKVKGEGGIDVYDPAQEARVHGYLQELNSGPLPREAVTSIFREIISASREFAKTNDHRLFWRGSIFYAFSGSFALW